MKKNIKFLTILLILVIAALFLPYRAWLENRLERVLESKGFENVELTISNAGLSSASLKNVSIGGESKLNVKNIVLEYSPRELWNGYLRDLSIAGIIVDVKQNNGRWVVSGLESWGGKSDNNVAQPLAIPIAAEEVANIPFERIKLEDSLLNIIFDTGIFVLPLDLKWQKSPQTHIAYKGDGLSLKLNGFEATAGNLTLDAYIDEENSEWAGPWALKNIAVHGTSVPVPVMSGDGNLSLNKNRLDLKGKFISDDRLWQAEFSMNYDFAVSGSSSLTILHAGMPWKEGQIDVHNLKIPFSGKDPIKMILQIKKVSVQELMESLTGDRIAATGMVSGSLPFMIGRDGKITILPGNLKSEGPGTISMPPDVIPGNNEQVALVRQILEDLNYTGLSISLKNDDSGRLGILMSFEGNNPDVYNGRPVKLNVNLTGDVIEFIQQNVLLLTSPEQFIKQRSDEKN